MPIEVRGARPEEMPEVLDMVPRVMGATREYFGSMYCNDPWGRPEHSRIVLVDGRIVSHIRLYDRWQRVGPIPVRVGGVGDVCTLPEYRKQGHCRALLEDALRYWDEGGYDLSMIVSGVGVYAACGWVPLAEIGFELPAENHHGAGGGSPYELRRFVRSEDLATVAAVYAAYNAERSLTTVRAPAYWERHFAWIAGEIEEAFLVAERNGQIVAYLRCEGGGQRLTLSECCHLPGHGAAAVALFDAALTFAAKRCIPSVQAHLPSDHPALAAARDRQGFTETESSLLLFRLVNLRRLLERLQPLLAERAREGGVEAEFVLAVGDQAAALSIRPGWVAVDGLDEDSTVRPASSPCLLSELHHDRVQIEPAAFFGLLFGAVEPAVALAGVAGGPSRALTVLFPRAAPVYWRTDIV